MAEEPEARPTSPEEAVLQEAESVLAQADPAAEGSMEVLDSARRILLVHAHPDDETIGNGVTMAKYAAEGAHVTLVTCTLGEEGEVLVPELAHLAADKDDAAGPAPDRRAGDRDGGARRPRPPLPRRPGPVPRLRDDGTADQRPAGLLLAGRPRRGGGHCSSR